MARLSVFWLLGSFLGCFVFVSFGKGFKNFSPEAFLIMIPVALIAGFVPAVITAVFDRALDRRGARGFAKYVLTSVCGYVAAYLLTIENAFEVTPIIPTDFSWGLIGLIPAMICSWLMETINNSFEN